PTSPPGSATRSAWGSLGYGRWRPRPRAKPRFYPPTRDEERVPPHRLSTKDVLLLGLTIGTIVVGGYLAWSANVDQRVFLVNGLDVATEIAIDGSSHGVPAGGKIEISLHRGIHR